MFLKCPLFLCFIWMIQPSSETSCDTECRGHDPKASSVIVKDTNGRLGNALFSYMVLLALQTGYGYEVYMGRRMNQTLTPFFGNLRIPVASGSLCDFQTLEEKLMDAIYESKLRKLEKLIVDNSGRKPSRGPDGRVIITQDDIRKYNIDIDALVHSHKFNDLAEISLPDSTFPWKIWNEEELSPMKSDEFKIGQAIIMYPNGMKIGRRDHEMLSSVPNIEKELENDFTLRQKFLNAAAKTLQRVLKKFLSSTKKRKTYDAKNITFIGIHSRRTDHLGLERVLGYKELKPSYFLEAMDLFKERFGDKVVYLYVSDDLEWGKQHLGPRVKKSKNVYFVGEGLGTQTDSIGHDLAVMQACNHSIISHGTFSYWAGFLSNGIVVIPDHFNDRTARPDIWGHPIDNPLPRMYHFV